MTHIPDHDEFDNGKRADDRQMALAKLPLTRGPEQLAALQATNPARDGSTSAPASRPGPPSTAAQRVEQRRREAAPQVEDASPSLARAADARTREIVAGPGGSGRNAFLEGIAGAAPIPRPDPRLRPLDADAARAGDVRPAAQDRAREFGVRDELRQQATPPPPDRRLVRDGRPLTPQEQLARGGYQFPIGGGAMTLPFEQPTIPRPLRATSGQGVAFNAAEAQALAQQRAAERADRLRPAPTGAPRESAVFTPRVGSPVLVSAPAAPEGAPLARAQVIRDPEILKRLEERRLGLAAGQLSGFRQTGTGAFEVQAQTFSRPGGRLAPVELAGFAQARGERATTPAFDPRRAAIQQERARSQAAFLAAEQRRQAALGGPASPAFRAQQAQIERQRRVSEAAARAAALGRAQADAARQRQRRLQFRQGNAIPL